MQEIKGCAKQTQIDPTHQTRRGAKIERGGARSPFLSFSQNPN